MTRIIGGAAGGRRLRTPRGDATRPTSDRVREGLFSSLESTLGTLAGVRGLDLYAGSGAVGLEMLSRGASLVTFVEKDRVVAGVLRDNAAAVGLRGADVRVGAVARVLAQPPAAPYDVCFLDPPYPLPEPDLAEALALLAGGWLAGEAVVVVERAARSPEPAWPDGFAPQRTRRYGETALHYAFWYRRDAPEPREPLHDES